MTTRHAKPLWRRPWALLIESALVALLLAFIAAASCSRLYWGYWFARPGIDPRVLSSTRLLSITPVTPEPQPDGSIELIPESGQYGIGWAQTGYPGPGWYAAGKAASPHEFDYYLLDRRALHALEQHGAAAAPLPSLPAERLAGLMPAALSTRWFASESPGYRQWKPDVWRYSGGMVYELVGADGRPLLLLALRGGEISNDHHPYYELLFDAPAQGPRRLLSARRFFFDVAGIEGLEFPGFFVSFSVFGLIIVVPITGVVLLARWFSRRASRRPGACPACGYDLTGNTTNICPECGRARVNPGS